MKVKVKLHKRNGRIVRAHSRTKKKKKPFWAPGTIPTDNPTGFDTTLGKNE